MGVRFEWDPAKAQSNLRKHGVSFVEAATVFWDPLAATTIDPRPEEEAEVRFVTVGTSKRGRLLVVAHCDRGDAIRIISAREPTRRERLSYEEGSQT
jgi:uncharacterized DUF497 family protein